MPVCAFCSCMVTLSRQPAPRWQMVFESGWLHPVYPSQSRGVKLKSMAALMSRWVTPYAAVAEPGERGGSREKRRRMRREGGGKIRAEVDALSRPRPPTETERDCDQSYGLFRPPYHNKTSFTDNLKKGKYIHFFWGARLSNFFWQLY